MFTGIYSQGYLHRDNDRICSACHLERGLEHLVGGLDAVGVEQLAARQAGQVGAQDADHRVGRLLYRVEAHDGAAALPETPHITSSHIITHPHTTSHIVTYHHTSPRWPPASPS